jgi:2',3'-cyclic-nucleotide 2'-phosphodiesterase/3'-nucleotidase
MPTCSSPIAGAAHHLPRGLRLPLRHLPVVPPAADQIHIRLLATTDMHVQIHPHDYYADRPVPDIGLARIAVLIGQHRAEVANCLLFDNGDVLQGNPMGDYAAEVRGPCDEAPHPAIVAMNTLGYDAATLGNHEFNYGLDFLRRALSGARFPVTCANVLTRAADDPAEDETLLPPFLLLNRDFLDGEGNAHRLRIGVIGFVPPQIMVWDRSHLSGHIVACDILTAAMARIPQMRAAGADLIIALCHSGIGSPVPHKGMENAATALAALPGIDALITGHSHLVFPGEGFAVQPGIDATAGTLAGKPAVMAGCFGSHLGVIDLVLQREHARWRIVRSACEAQPVSHLPPAATDPRAEALLAATRADHEATIAHIRRPVGRSEIPLTTFFAVLPGNAALDLIARAQAWHVARALADTPHAAVPLLSAASPFKMGGRGGPGHYTDVPAGDLAFRHVADLYSYPNTISAVLVTGSDLRDWLEHAAGVFRTITPGLPDQPLMDPQVPSSHFDVISGVTWEIDLSQPSKRDAPGEPGRQRAGRVRHLRHKGQPVAATDRFVIATNSYRAGGGASFPGANGDTIVFQGQEPNRDILLRFLEESPPVTRQGPPNWRFVPMPRTSVVYDTAPRATAHVDTLAPLQVELEGPAPGGFARFRIHL